MSLEQQHGKPGMIRKYKKCTLTLSDRCPGGHCWVELFNPVSSVPQQKLVKFDEEDHNLLGGLQLVAKALEVWVSEPSPTKHSCAASQSHRAFCAACSVFRPRGNGQVA